MARSERHFKYFFFIARFVTATIYSDEKMYTFIAHDIQCDSFVSTKSKSRVNFLVCNLRKWVD